MTDFIKVGCLVVVGTISILLLVFAIALAVGVMRLPLTNLDRIVTQHTLQYVQSHQQAVLNYYSDYVSGDEAHKKAALLELCAQAAMLDPNEYPAQAAPTISANCH